MAFAGEQAAALIALATTRILDDDNDGARDMLLKAAAGLSKHFRAEDPPDGTVTPRAAFSAEQTATLILLATAMILDDDSDGARDILLITVAGLSRHFQAGDSPDGKVTPRAGGSLENSGRDLKRLMADTGDTGNSKKKSRTAAPSSPQSHVEEDRRAQEKQTHEEKMNPLVDALPTGRSAQIAGPASASSASALEMRKVALQERSLKTSLLEKMWGAAKEASRDGYGSKEDVRAAYASYSKALKESTCD